MDIHPEDVRSSKFAVDVQIEPLDAGRLAEDLLPLMAAAGDSRVAAVDIEEVDYLLRLTDLPTRIGWTASLSKRTVGFVLIQDDHAAALYSTRGGKAPWRGLYS
jgi:hypothetical protein